MISWEKLREWLDETPGLSYVIEGYELPRTVKITITNSNETVVGGAEAAEAVLFTSGYEILSGRYVVSHDATLAESEVYTALIQEARVRPAYVEQISPQTAVQAEEDEAVVESWENDQGLSLDELADWGEDQPDTEELQELYDEEAEESTGEKK